MAKKDSKRAKGTGCLIKRGDIWTARWVRDGKVYVRSTEESEKKEAVKKLAQFLEPFSFKNDAEKMSAMSTRIAGSEAQAEALLPSLTILNSFKAYSDSTSRPDSGARTLKNYESQFNRLVEWIKSKHPEVTELRYITKEIASEFAVELSKTLTTNSFNKYIVLFRRIWNVLAENSEARLKLNPWIKKFIGLKKETQHIRRELTVEELGKVIAAVSGEMKLLFAIGIYSGLRLGDASCLKWGSVDMVRRRITLIPSKIARTKDPKPVQIPIHETLFRLLCEIPEPQRFGYVMPELAAVYMKGESKGATLSKRIQKIFASCGIETKCTITGSSRSGVDVGFHSLRHTFVSLNANAGVPMAMVQALVGHSSPVMTRHYQHDDFNAVQAAVYTLPDVSGTDTATEPTDATGSELEAIMTKLDKLTKEELKELIKQAQKIIKTK